MAASLQDASLYNRVFHRAEDMQKPDQNQRAMDRPRKNADVYPSTPKKAYENEQFINSHDARIVRILAEFLEPQARFRKYRVSDTVVFFGSARVLPPEQAQRELEEIRRKGKPKEVGEAERRLAMSRYYADARELARLLTVWSKGLGKGKRRFIVCSGGGPGIMEAASRGAHDAGGLSIGFNISLPFEQMPNRYVTREMNFEFHYFFIRKYWFAYMAKGLVIFPGGFGTLDELSELLTLIQTQKLRKRIPVVIYGSEYWKKVLDFEEMVKWGTLAPEDLDYFKYCDTPKEAFQTLTASLEEFYGDKGGFV
jgi:uncharacterized protein (TIGR00730 family)